MSIIKIKGSKEFCNLNNTTNNRKICFSCLNPYHLFISYILSKTVYKNDYKVLLLSDYHGVIRRAYKNILGHVKLWDEVILIKDRSYNQRHIELKKINFNDIDVLHYFTYAFYNYILFDYLEDTTKIILTDEGTMTYLFRESFDISGMGTIDFNKILEIWLLDKNLYVSKLNKPLENIKIEKSFRNSSLLNEICKELNYIFDYNHSQIHSDIVFFDQPLKKANILNYSQEKKALLKVFNELKSYKVAIKKHPSDYYSKYDGIKSNIIKDNEAPWELILLNECLKNESNLYNKVFISYHSSSLINSQILLKIFNIPTKSVFMYKYLESSTKKVVVHRVFEELIREFKKYYGENIHDISSLEELRLLLNKLL